MSSRARIALISDVHGNLHALVRVLEDAHARGVDGVACLGDVCTLGPHPREVLALIRDHARWFILGNHDEYMSRPELLSAHSEAPPVVSAVQWCRSELDTSSLDFLRSFAARAQLDLGEGIQLLLFHGSPESNTRDLLAETRSTELDDLLRDHPATVLAGGHTHLQMLRQHRGQLIVNPGSVGLPFESYAAGGPPSVMGHAEYAVVEARRGNVSVALHRVELDRAELIRQVQGWSEPLGAYLVAQYQR